MGEHLLSQEEILIIPKLKEDTYAPIISDSNNKQFLKSQKIRKI